MAPGRRLGGSGRAGPGAGSAAAAAPQPRAGQTVRGCLGGLDGTRRVPGAVCGRGIPREPAGVTVAVLGRRLPESSAQTARRTRLFKKRKTTVFGPCPFPGLRS